MNKPIFENEKEALEFCRQMDFRNQFTVVKVMKEKGYIKKSDLSRPMKEFFKSIQSSIQSSTKKENKMDYERITIKIVNNGFSVDVGCQSFVFTSEKELFQAISDYKKDPEKAQEKYCK